MILCIELVVSYVILYDMAALDIVTRYTLCQSTKAEMCTNDERRRTERASPTLRHTLQRNWRRAQMCIAHFTI
jgi:lambda repressor-like predicted transcriptional regulator